MSIVEGTRAYPYPASADKKLGDTATDLMNTSRDPVTTLSQSWPGFITVLSSSQNAPYLAIHLANDEMGAYQAPEQS